MNIIEAAKTGLPMRRKGWKTWDYHAAFREDLTADDWEVRHEPVTITREQWDEAVEAAYTKAHPESICRGKIELLAKELGLGE